MKLHYALTGVVATFAFCPPAVSADRALGEYLASQCVSCHMAGEAGGIPRIAGMPEPQFIAALNSYKSRQRESDVMQSIASRLSQDDIEALAAYFSAQGK